MMRLPSTLRPRAWLRLSCVAALLIGVRCRPTGATDAPPDPARVAACEAALRRALADTRDRQAEAPERIHVQGADASCAAAAERVASTPGVELWTRQGRRRCPGRRCGPTDGNPLLTIAHDHADCFRVTELRWTGGFGSTRCLDDRTTEPGAGPLHDVVVY